MLKVRLQRVGRKNDPSFRMIVTDSRRAAKKSSFVEVVGTYDARKGEPQIKGDRVKHWISFGAQPSATVHNLLVNAKIIDAKKINVLPKKTAPKKEEIVEEVAAPVVAAAAPEVVEEVVAEEAPAAEEAVVEEAPAEETPAA
ncbi:MAG: 30S ribosomal protein S16 [Candidatus Yonathbacteria bacterium RIFOXYC1_FULL_52_10]|uniref:Small ribosomal subunit protein bS16 n=1 Tax=Candidatus Yonathbacteria bacterium RIFOXYD1_FULL_52_36 TaxID=1802730 RepID=A0A1G2SIP2_9BACT|nr:MAG: 30S ribosomal protein S16 [Candidatus Yonathbacteria bacterium RIFOXYC1_FULL_52_10]OHA84967.1 MAG: 30S ribosomal protein S16 [Candidatus Yonathbacteria bacterium RIFOXYD1_FULL_52_36]